MSASHLFNSLRLIFNHTITDEHLKIPGGREYEKDSWSEPEKHKIIHMLIEELEGFERQLNLTEWQRKIVDGIKVYNEMRII